MPTTVGKLIQQLKLLPSETLVLVDGYEGGYADISKPKSVKVKLNVNQEDYYGPHEESIDADVNAIVIGRTPNQNSK